MDHRLQSLAKLFRRAPIRTALLSAVPVLLAVIQVLNGYYFDAPLAVVAAFGAVMIGFAVVVTRYHISAMRRDRIVSTTFETGRAD